MTLPTPPAWLRGIDQQLASAWMKRVSQPKVLEQAIEATQHDKNSPVWAWVAQAMAHQAIVARHSDSLRVLLRHEGARLDWDALWTTAAGYLELRMMKDLAACSEELNIDRTVGVGDRTALHLAAADGAQDLVEWLVSRGADWGKLDADGRSAWQAWEQSATFQKLDGQAQGQMRQDMERRILSQNLQTAAPAPARPRL